MKNVVQNILRDFRNIFYEESAIEPAPVGEHPPAVVNTFHRRHPQAFFCLHVLAILFMALAAFLTLNVNAAGILAGYFNVYDISFSYLTFPMLLLGGAGGFIPAMFCFFIVFIAELLVHSEVAYSSFIFLIALCMSYLLARGSWFRSKKKALLSVPLMSFVVGVVGAVINELMSMNGLGNVSVLNAMYYLAAEVPECAFSALILYFWYSHMPHDIRRVFRVGDYDATIRKYGLLRGRKGRSGKRRWISVRISMIILLEAAILAVSAASFSNLLISEMGEAILNTEDHLSLPSWAELDEQGRPIPPEFRRNWNSSGESGEENSAKEEDAGGSTSAEASGTTENSGTTEASGSTETTGSTETGGTTGDTGTSETSEANVPFRRTWITNTNLAFDIRLIMMLFNMAVPIAVLADFYAQMTIARPINRMASTMKSFTHAPDEKKENYVEHVHRLNIRSRDELQDLYECMDRMVEDVVDYGRRVEAEQRLRADLLVAEKSSQAKSDFLSSMSHEIRTPINAVLGMDEMILREAEDETILNYATDIQNAGQSLLSLVNDILDFSKIEAGKLEIIPVEYELASTINDLVNMISQRAEKKGLELIIRVDPTIPHMLYGDEIRMKQVVTNILTNAVKYTEEGSVTLSVSWTKEVGEEGDDEFIGLSFSVRDTGIGMKAEDLKKLYSPFERIEEKRNRSIEGTGLGMSIVKRLLEQMGTSLQVESVYGEGSDFSFTIAQRVVKWEPIGDYTVMYEQAVKEQRKQYRQSFTAPEARLLIVDDTRMNLTVVCSLLKQTRVRIDTAMSGKEALEKVREMRYDIIFLDHMMPEMDGLETLQAMRELTDSKNEGVPVIALTANAVSGAREMYLAAGFVDYLSKPVSGSKLEKLLLEYLPKELVTLEAEEDPARGEEQKKDTPGPETKETRERKEEENVSEQERGLEAILYQIEGIDVEEALKNCGDADIALDIIREYRDTIESRAGDIEKYFEEGDLKNYTVLVHALKSSSRLIGAMELSGLARELEDAGNRAMEEEKEDAGNRAMEEEKEEQKDRKGSALSTIREKTPSLLSLYRSYLAKLAPAAGEAVGDAEDERPEIPLEELKSAYKTMGELVEAFDYDSAEDVFHMLDDYRIPSDEEERYKGVKAALQAVDQEKLMELLRI